MSTELLMAVTTIIFIILWYLLRQKDANQAEDIKRLYRLHHDDETKLHNLELEIARNHYPKNELDLRFAQLDSTLKTGFNDLRTDFKELTKALQDHLQKSHGQ